MSTTTPELVASGAENIPQFESIKEFYIASELDELMKSGIKIPDEIIQSMVLPGYTQVQFKKDMLSFLKKLDITEMTEHAKPFLSNSIVFFENLEIEDAQWEQLRKIPKQSEKTVARAVVRVNEAKEKISFTFRQQQILGDPRISVEKLDFYSHDLFIGSLTDQVYGRLKKIADVYRQQQVQANMAKEMQKLQKSDAIENGASDTNVFKALQKGQSTLNTGKNIFRIFNKEASLLSDPLMFHIFGKNPDSMAGIIKELRAGKGKDDIKDKLKIQLTEIFPLDEFDEFKKDITKNKFISFSRLKEDYADKEKGEDAKARIMALADLLDTMPKAYHDTKWGTRYETYIEKKGELSLTFNEWIETQNTSMLEKLFYTLIKPIMDFFENIGEKSEDKLQSTKYREILEKAPANGNFSSESTSNTSPMNLDSFLEESDAGKHLADTFERVAGERITVDQLDFTINGDDFRSVSVEQDYFDKIEKFIDIQPNGWKLLTKGLDIEDIKFLIEHKGDDNVAGDGINVEFGNESFEMSIDLSGLDKGVKQYLDELAGAGGLVGGALLTAWAFSGPVGWALGGLVLGGGGAAAGYFGIGSINTDLEKISYDDIDSTKLKDLINRAHTAIGEVEKLSINDIKGAIDGWSKYDKYFDLQEGDKFPHKILADRKFCGSMESLFKHIDGNESGYKLDGEKLVLLDKYFKDGGDDYDDMVFRIKEGNDWLSWDENVYMANGDSIDGDNKDKLPNGFLHIDGGGEGFTDDNFENLDAFFHYLKNSEFKED